MEKLKAQGLGKIQLNRVKTALRDLSFESKGFIELTNRLNDKGEIEENQAVLFDVLGQPSEVYYAVYEWLYKLFNGVITPANYQAFISKVDVGIEKIKEHRPVRDGRQSKEELQERARKLQEAYAKQQEKEKKFNEQAIDIPEECMAIMLDVCFNDSDMMTDYYSPHRCLESKLLAIVKKQAQRESLARRVVDQIPDLKQIPWTWHTENYSGGHGNYLKADHGHERRKYKAYDGREEVVCFYEITFNGYTKKEVPHPQYFLGDLTKPKPGDPGAQKTVRKNEEKNGIEIVFNEKPGDDTLTALKANGWRWSRFAGLWYNRNTEDNLKFAESL